MIFIQIIIGLSLFLFMGSHFLKTFHQSVCHQSSLNTSFEWATKEKIKKSLTNKKWECHKLISMKSNQNHQFFYMNTKKIIHYRIKGKPFSEK